MLTKPPQPRSGGGSHRNCGQQENSHTTAAACAQIQLEEMAELGTLNDYLGECGYVHENNVFTPHIEMVVFEKQSIQVA